MNLRMDTRKTSVGKKLECMYLKQLTILGATSNIVGEINIII
jgi:hypothetical protein